MPVDPVASASKGFKPAGAAGSCPLPISVPDNPNQVMLVSAYWFGEPNISASTFTASLGGVELELMDSQIWDNTDKLMLFGISDPEPGLDTLAFNYSGVPNSGLRCLCLAGVVYANVAAIGDTVKNTPATTTVNTVTVPSVSPAHRTVFAHATREKFTGTYNRTKRADLFMKAASGALFWYDQIDGQMIMGDAPGAATVASTLEQVNTADWGAIGVNLGPTPVDLNIECSMPAPVTTLDLTVYRVQETDPNRTWIIPNAKRGSGAKQQWDHKFGSVLDYTFDFTNVLTGDDEVVNVAFKVSPNLPTPAQPTSTSTTGTFWVGGVRVGQIYTITAHAVSDGGREYEYSATLRCVA